jgi:hypothetical protein
MSSSTVSSGGAGVCAAARPIPKAATATIKIVDARIRARKARRLATGAMSGRREGL